MTISPLLPSAPVASPAASKLTGSQAPGSAPTVDYTEFLQLLVAELKNQDPTSPTDPTQYMSQLASFSTVEQQVQTNATLDALLSAQASNIIGKTVKSADGTNGDVELVLRNVDPNNDSVHLRNRARFAPSPGDSGRLRPSGCPDSMERQAESQAEERASSQRTSRSPVCHRWRYTITNGTLKVTKDDQVSDLETRRANRSAS
jgi:flagellar basal-body rod modification protein FlgD